MKEEIPGGEMLPHERQDPPTTCTVFNSYVRTFLESWHKLYVSGFFFKKKTVLIARTCTYNYVPYHRQSFFLP